MKLTAKGHELPPITIHLSEFEGLEKAIKDAFKEVLYKPIIKALGVSPSKLSNSKDDSALTAAIKAGRIFYQEGYFHGKYNSKISKELKAIGAKWDKRKKAFFLPTKIPAKIQLAISFSEHEFQKSMEKVFIHFQQNLPEEISAKVHSEKFFDSALWKVNREIDNTLKSLAVFPKLPDEARKKIALEWRDNMDLWIKDFAVKEITSLRDTVSEHIAKGGRYEQLVRDIRESYGVTERKAKFLARQETNLLMSKFKEVRYQDAGVEEYVWYCVAGSPKHPVRPSHKVLQGKVFRWDDPPVTTMPGEPERRNNPGEDYNCRCYARPLVKPKVRDAD
jgi:SPP1 gp7 family putative phage head morphogenesis protein